MTYENEYKERAYQKWKSITEDDEYRTYDINQFLFYAAFILDTSTGALSNDFELRYESERDTLEKIKDDVDKSSLWMLTGFKGIDVVPAATVKKLIDRTVAVMERDK